MGNLDLSNPALRIVLEPYTLQLIALPAAARLPTSILKATAGDSFFSMTRTGEELSILATEQRAKSILDVLPEGTVLLAKPSVWKALKIAGPLDLSMVGVMLELLRPLTEASVSIFASSTFLTDYILVKDHDSNKAVSALKGAGWQIAD